jgi:hypothetical protein
MFLAVFRGTIMKRQERMPISGEARRRPYLPPQLVKRDKLARITGDDEISGTET